MFIDKCRCFVFMREKILLMLGSFRFSFFVLIKLGGRWFFSSFGLVKGEVAFLGIE